MYITANLFGILGYQFLSRMMSTIAIIFLKFVSLGTCISNVRCKQGFQQKPATGEFCRLLLKSLAPTFYIKFRLSRFCCFLINIIFILSAEFDARMQGDSHVTGDDSLTE